MRAKLLGCAGLIVVLALQLSGRTTAQGQGPSQDVRALYDRAESFGRRTQGLMYNVAEAPTWIEGSAQFWYRKSVKGGNEFVSSIRRRRRRRRRSITRGWRRRLSTAASAQYTAVTLPFNAFTFVNNAQAIEFTVGGRAAADARAAAAVAARTRGRRRRDTRHGGAAR